MKDPKRKKYWETERIFHCSIAGTCLTVEEVKNILLEAGVKIPSDTLDYKIHSAAVESGNGFNPVSNGINKKLETKFRRDILQYSKINDSDSLLKKWNESVSHGNIPGPYWALMSHPLAETPLLDHAFGVVHMLSHLNGVARSNELEKIELFKTKYEKERESKNWYRTKLKSLETKLKQQNNNTAVIQSLKKKLRDSEEEVKSLKVEVDDKIQESINIAVKDFSIKHSNKISEKNTLIEKLSSEISLLKEKNKMQKNEIQTKNFELEGYRQGLNEIMRSKKPECLTCMNQNCKCRYLENKCILYVGGKTSVIPRCRELVEQEGGSFIHHDGGIEENFLRLPEVLLKADLVCCPADCISHNAYNKIKKQCRQQNKDFVILRSSGLSSFSETIHSTFIN